MSTPTPGGDHLDLDALAALDEGLTDDDVAAAQEEHLAQCPTCDAARAKVRTTRALLSTLPSESMPDDVARRIDTAIASSSGTIVPTALPRRRLWARHPSLAGLVAAAAVAGLVAAVAVGAIRHNSNDSGTAAGGASAPNTALTPARNFPITESGRDYTLANVLALAPRLARESTVPGGPPRAAGVKPKPLPHSLQRLHASRPALDACIAALNAGSPAPQQPYLVDFARYGGKPAVIVLMPGVIAGHIDVWVVGPQCSSSDAHLILYKSTLSSG